MPVFLKRRNGEITEFRNADFIPAFYYIPKSILDRCGAELNSIPRNPRKLLHDWNAIAKVESDLFILAIIDAYAYMVWPFMGLGGKMEIYSGYEPSWIFAHAAPYWIYEMQDEGILPKTRALLEKGGVDENFGYVSESEIAQTFSWIIPQASRVQELRKHRRRNTATGKASMFSGLVYCADCGSKLNFCASNSIKDGQEFFRCSQYKENRGSCSIHYIRDAVLKEVVLETIQNVAKFVAEFEPVFLYLFAKQNTAVRKMGIRQMKQNIEASKRRIKELDKLIERIYEDNVLGKISDERFCRMSANYEIEQKELLAAVEHDEQELLKAEQEKIDLKVFLEAIRECIDLKELTPTIVNTLIKRIDVHSSIKDDDGVKHVPLDISFTAVGIINIPTEKELMQVMEEMRGMPLKTA